MKRYSEKRQAILDCLRSTKTHPTAEWIYEQLRSAYPDLSFATVYRNLRQMKEAGLVRSIGTVDDHERFDGTITPHFHAVCNRCGRVDDVEGLELPPELLQRAESSTGFCITDTALRFVGLCPACAEQND